MSYFIEHEKDANIPDWLKPNLSSKCAVCGSAMLNYYNDSNRCTNRRCSNECCPGMLAARFVGMCKILGVKGVGYATGLSVIRQYNLTSHVDVISYVLAEVLEITLGKFLRVMQFEGIDGEWESLCTRKEYYTLDELFEKYDGPLLDILVANKDELYRCSKFFKFKGPVVEKAVEKTIREFNIMITGTPRGFDSKDSYVATLNYYLRGIIKIYHIPHKRKSNVDYLIREEGSKTKGKYEAALEAGIPIVTSEKFLEILTNILKEEQQKLEKG